MRGPGIWHSDDDTQKAKSAVKQDPLQINFDGETAIMIAERRATEDDDEG